MFSLSRNFLKFAAASAFVALTVSGTPTCADEMAQNLGPVGAAGRHRAHQCHKQMLQSGRRLRLFPPLVPHSFLQQVYHRQTGLYRRVRRRMVHHHRVRRGNPAALPQRS